MIGVEDLELPAKLLLEIEEVIGRVGGFKDPIVLEEKDPMFREMLKDSKMIHALKGKSYLAIRQWYDGSYHRFFRLVLQRNPEDYVEGDEQQFILIDRSTEELFNFDSMMELLLKDF